MSEIVGVTSATPKSTTHTINGASVDLFPPAAGEGHIIELYLLYLHYLVTPIHTYIFRFVTYAHVYIFTFGFILRVYKISSQVFMASLKKARAPSDTQSVVCKYDACDLHVYKHVYLIWLMFGLVQVNNIVDRNIWSPRVNHY